MDALLGKDTGVSEDMDLKDLAQVFTAVAAVTNKTEDNTATMNVSRSMKMRALEQEIDKEPIKA